MNKTTYRVIALAYLAPVALGACTITNDTSDAGSDAAGSNAPDAGAGATTDSSAPVSGDAAVPTTDAGAEAATNDASGLSSPDSAQNDGGGPTEGGSEEGGGSLGPSCIKGIFGTYVVRADGVAIEEGPPEKVVIDDASGTASTPLQGVLSVQQQEYAACAVVSGGSVRCWQRDATNGNAYGQLGNGNKTAIATFRAVTVLKSANTPLTNVVALASGQNSDAACAITDDRQLWCWGNLTWIANGGSQLYAVYAQPITLDGQTALTGVLQAAIGFWEGCAVIQGSPNNAVWCWGTNSGEELGQGDTKNRQYPVKVPGLTSPTKVVLSYTTAPNGGYPYGDATCELDGDSVLCWGRNDNGATGGSSGVDPVPAPTQVTTSTMSVLRGVVDLQEGGQGFGVLRNDGTVWLWGAPDGNTAYAKSYGVTNILELGWANAPRYVTSDGVYHNGMANVTVNCGAFQ